MVTAVAENGGASFPPASWMALESLPAVGSVYATVTEFPTLTIVPIVMVTVDADATTEEMDALEPATITENAVVAAVVAESASL